MNEWVSSEERPGGSFKKYTFCWLGSEVNRHEKCNEDRHPVEKWRSGWRDEYLESSNTEN